MKLHLALMLSSFVLTVGTAASAQSAQDEASNVTPDSSATHIVPEWRSRATGEDVMRLYPPVALRRSVEGLVLVECHVLKDGNLTGCVAEQEAPAGYGFGAAALRMMPRFQMKPQTVDGGTVEGGVVRLPIQFRLPR